MRKKKETKYIAGYRHRISLPPLPSMKVNTLYTFTINVKYHGGTLLKNHVTYVRKFNEIKAHVGGVLLHWDINPKGHLHYHGFIAFETKRQILDLYRFFEFSTNFAIEIDTITDLKTWIKYCMKMKEFSEETVDQVTVIAYNVNYVTELIKDWEFDKQNEEVDYGDSAFVESVSKKAMSE